MKLLFFHPILLMSTSLALFPLVAPAQHNSVPSRIIEAIDETRLTLLKDNTHPLARPELDRGPAPPTLALDRMLLVLRRSPEQDAALLTLLKQQQDKSSPNYHSWLTPEQFGEQFGASGQDIETVTSWLGSHGFRVNRVAKGRTVIEFSGTAGQLLGAFHTEIHRYSVNGEDHWANSSDPQIPTALAPVVVGVATLHNFLKKPQIVISGDMVSALYRPGAQPQVTVPSGVHALGPGDFATIYNATSLYNSSITGNGTFISVVGRSNINVQDILDFRSVFSLTGGNFEVFVDGPDPGDLGGNDEAEAVLDSTWSGAVAPGAFVSLVVSASTNVTDGIDLSELSIIDGGGINVMSESFGTCEGGVTSAEASNIAALAQQAAAQGITYVVSSGDTGAEGCDTLSATSATGPISVNVLASSPYTVAVGGTQFNENGHNTTYWNPSSGTLAASAKSYIPEDVWNESCASSCSGGAKPNIAAGGGGASEFFPQPSWQSGVIGIPNDNARHLPDVALNAAAGHDPYLICLHLSCEVNSQGQISLLPIGGTSASAPAFAGIMALVNQKTGTKQGQADYVLYRLASQETLSQCDGSSQTGLPASTCVFNDVNVGNNAVPGEAGYGTSTAKYQAGVGYDSASGLGSVNVANLVNNWGNARSTNSVVNTFTLNPTTNIQHGTTPVNFNVTVAPQTGTGTPTGDVSLIAQVGIDALPFPVTATTLANGSSSGTTNLLPGGTYTVIAHYEGDGVFLPSNSSSVQVTVTPELTSTVISAFQGSLHNPMPFVSGTYGSPFAVSATVSGQSGNGIPTGNVAFTADGNPVSTGFFPSLGIAGLAVLPSGFIFPPPGQHSISAQYNGDASFNSSTSNTVTFAITPVSTRTSVQSSSSVVPAGQSVTLTASVTATSSGNSPTGTVKFFAGQTQIGTVTLSSSQGSQGLALATATLLTSQLPFGQDSITAQYAGDTNYQSSTSPAISVNVGAFAIAASPTTIVVTSPGQAGSTMLTFTAQNGFNGSSALTPSLCSQLPSQSTCSFSPSTIAFTSSTNTATVTLTVNTQAPAGGLVPSTLRLVPGSRLRTREIAIMWVIGTCFLLFARKRPWRWSAVLALIGLVVISSVAGCGGGSSGPPPPPSNPGTPVGNYSGVTVTVTIAGVTESIKLQVNVQ
jgi:hypothetical protein